MNILITGGSGFIGGYVYRHLKNQGFSVKNMDIHGNENDPDYINGSILDFKSVSQIIFDNHISIIFHFAGFSNINKVKDSPRECIDLNIMGTTNILEVARLKGDTAVILASSVYVHSDYGHFYTSSKIAAEKILNNYSLLFKIKTNILRLGTVYGENSRHEDVISVFAKKIINKNPISINGDGFQTRNFIHGNDVAKACEKILVNRVFDEILIISSKLSTSINQIVDLFKDLDSSLKVQYNELDQREDDYDGYVGNVSKTFKKLDWSPDIDIKEGVKKIYDYHQRSKI